MNRNSSNNPDASRQVPLFSNTPSSPARDEKPQPTPDPQPHTNQNDELNPRSPEQLSPAEHGLRVLESICRSRRWERQLRLGATDRELQVAFGNCWCSAPPINCQFQPDAEPALRCTDSTFNVEIFTMSAEEVASHIRRLVGVPQPKSQQEQESALQTVLSEQRAILRREMLPYVRSLLGEKTPHKAKQTAPPPLSEEVLSLLFLKDCLTEKAERRTLMRITSLLITRLNQNTIKAAKTAIAIIEGASSRWRHIEAYWLEPQRSSSPIADQPQSHEG